MTWSVATPMCVRAAIEQPQDQSDDAAHRADLLAVGVARGRHRVEVAEELVAFPSIR